LPQVTLTLPRSSTEIALRRGLQAFKKALLSQKESNIDFRVGIYKKGLRGIIYLVIGLDQGLRKYGGHGVN
jgi:hypothetical protein